MHWALAILATHPPTRNEVGLAGPVESAMIPYHVLTLAFNKLSINVASAAIFTLDCFSVEVVQCDNAFSLTTSAVQSV